MVDEPLDHGGGDDVVAEEYLAGRLTTQELQLALMSAEKLGFISSTQVAVNHLEELRALYRVGGDVATPEFNLQAAAARAQSTIDALARATGIGLQRDVFGTAAVWGDRAAKMGGREAVVLSARASGRRWRRVTDGDPCAFCATLATRGILDKGYRSEESAAWTKTGEKYHDRCGCIAVEIIEDLPLTAQEKAWVEQYQSAADLAHAEGLPATPETVLPTMRNQGNFHDSPKPRTQAGGADGGRKPQPRARGMLGPDTPDEFPEFNGWRPLIKRSEIDDFDAAAAEEILDGRIPDDGHGHHRSRSGRGKSEFPPGWGEAEVVDWVRGALDHPGDMRPTDRGINVTASFNGVRGLVALQTDGRGTWWVATAHPL